MQMPLQNIEAEGTGPPDDNVRRKNDMVKKIYAGWVKNNKSRSVISKKRETQA